MKVVYLFLASSLVLLAACGTDENDKTYKLTRPTPAANVKNLMSTFVQAWNRKDSATLMTLFDNDAVLLSGRDRLSGKNDLAKNWLHTVLPLTNNLQVTDAKNENGFEMAYTAGTWTMDINMPGQPTTSSAGNHTFVWKKVQDTAWLLTLISIDDYASE